MSSKQQLDKSHRCIAAKCKGHLSEPKENYGHWAYWRPGPNGSWGWFSTPDEKQK